MHRLFIVVLLTLLLGATSSSAFNSNTASSVQQRDDSQLLEQIFQSPTSQQDIIVLTDKRVGPDPKECVHGGFCLSDSSCGLGYCSNRKCVCP